LGYKNRFDGIFALSHFTLSESQFNQTKELLVPSINKTITEMEQNRYTEAPWTQAPDGNGGEDKPQCEYIVYAQLHPVDYGVNGEPMDLDTLKDIEREMRFPTGSATPKPPPLIASAMIYSPNCGSVLVADGLEGKKLWAIYDQATHFALGAAVLASLQIWVLIRQMNESNTLSTISRVSFWMITMMAVVDGYYFFIFMAAALLLGPATFLAMVTVSFCYLMLSAVFGMRFLVTTYRVQRQSAPATVTITAPAPTPTPTPVAPPPSNTAEGLPMPATAEAQTPLVIPPAPNTTINQSTTAAVTDEEVNSEIGSLHMKFYFLLVGIFFFTLYVATWPPFFRDLLVHSLLIFVNSYWVPQIHRNVMRGCRKALQWEFVFGMSVLRLVPVFYFYLYPKNIFLLDPNPQAVAVISGWVWIQCMVLVSQDVLGPRFLVPSRSLPQVYDYHSALPVDEEAAQAMGSPVDDGRARSFDCVVCMQTVEVPTAGTGDGRDGGGEPIGLLGRRGYMVTPCKHVFHTHCLEGWMRHRLQCPICRCVEIAETPKSGNSEANIICIEIHFRRYERGVVSFGVLFWSCFAGFVLCIGVFGSLGIFLHRVSITQDIRCLDRCLW
jgi:hypothetical protein